MKKTIARGLGDREQQKARRILRDLRDHNRRELASAAIAKRRARGLRLYAAWKRTQPAAPTCQVLGRTKDGVELLFTPAR